MFATILTWVGSLFGVAVLVVMAAGALASDLDGALERRRARRRPAARDGAGGQPQPL